MLFKSVFMISCYTIYMLKHAILEFAIDFECQSGGGEPSSRFSSELGRGVSTSQP